MSSPVTAKQMRLSISANGSVYTVAVVEMTNIELLREGGVEPRYGLRGTEPDDRHKVGQKRAKFTLRRWFKTDPNQGKVFYDIHNNDLLFTLREYIKNSSDFAGLSMGECSSYDYREITGTANDIIGEEISGEGTVWEKYSIESGWFGPVAGYEYEICTIGFWATTNRANWNFKYWCDQYGFRVKHYEWNTVPTITTAFLSQYPIVIFGRASDKTLPFTNDELTALKDYALCKGSLFIFADVDYPIDSCAKINQVAALFGCTFGAEIVVSSITPSTGQAGHQLWTYPEVIGSYPISWDSLPDTIDTSKATMIGWYGPSNLPALVIGKTEQVLLTGFDSVIDNDTTIRNVINFFEGTFTTDESSCWFIDASTLLGNATEVDMDLAWNADDNWNYYISLYDAWTVQRIAGHEVYDFGSIKNTTYYVRWQAILTAQPVTWAGHVDCEIYAGDKLVTMALKASHSLDAPAGGSANFGIETQSFVGNYRYVMICFKSLAATMCIDPTKLWVNGVWRD